MASTAAAYVVLAGALAYPAPGHLATLEAGLADLPDGPVKSSFANFVNAQRDLTLGAWEELYTRTLDLNPPAAPYVGYQIWGEAYGRGTFLAEMSRALADAGVDTGGELPDHLAPVLRYLGAVAEPLPALLEALPKALNKMIEVLRRADAGNPYVDLLLAIQAQCSDLKKEAV